MCRSIKPPFNFAPPATEDEVRAAALQFVRKIAGTRAPSKAEHRGLRARRGGDLRQLEAPAGRARHLGAAARPGPRGGAQAHALREGRRALKRSACTAAPTAAS